MQIYLPIAEMSLNALMLLGLGGMVGFLSGMFGVGGGFLMTPLLIFIGVPPAVAVLVAVWTFTEGWLLRHFGLLLCYLIIVLFVKWFVFGFFGFFLVRFGFLVFFRFACSI